MTVSRPRKRYIKTTLGQSYIKEKQRTSEYRTKSS